MNRLFFYIKYFFQNVRLTLHLLGRGEFGRVSRALYARLYKFVLANIAFWFRRPFLKMPETPSSRIEVQTNHPVAFASPDHLAPYGTKYNDSTNKGFVLAMHDWFSSRYPATALAFMDLGCSGGQLVKDFLTLHWLSVGLEGSDYSLKHKRANWRELAGKHLFTSDITKPFFVTANERPLKFHLITAWEVMEHIHPDDLDAVFRNIRDHLVEGGCFVASTCSGPSVVDGIELHQTRLNNAGWRKMIEDRYKDLEPVDLQLKTHQYVRYDFGEPSFLVYRKRAPLATDAMPKVA